MIWNAMVWSYYIFRTGSEGRITSPRAGFLADNQKCVPSCQSGRSSYPPKLVRTHECGPGGCSTPNRIFCISSRGGKSVPGKPAEADGRGGAEHPPLWRRLSYCVSFMQQGKVQESVAHPQTITTTPLPPQSPPRMGRRVLSASVGVMESVPVLQP
jgi:hypothetical protein